jgi:hypothetical protein
MCLTLYFNSREVIVSDEKNKSTAGTVVAVIIVGAMAWFYFGGGLEKQAARSMQDITKQVAGDAVTQYEMVKRSGTATDICFHAGMVAAAYLQAKDEPGYQRWKATENADCTKAGVPR